MSLAQSKLLGTKSHNYGATTSTSDMDFETISERVAFNLKSITTNCRQLDKHLKVIGTDHDSSAVRDQVHIVNTSTNEQIKATIKYFGRMKTLCQSHEKLQKLILERQTTEFKAIVEAYSKSQKDIGTKMKQFHLANASQNDDQEDKESAQDDHARKQKQLMAKNTLQYQVSMLEDRAKRVQNIEEDALALNEIMRELAGMTHEQGGHIDVIEQSIVKAGVDVETGHSDLQNAADHQASSRRKLVIAVIIGLVIIVLLIIIFCSSIK